MKPRSISIPSVKSISSVSVCPSSTIVAPLAPTRLKQLAIVRPIDSEPVAIVATDWMSLSSSTGRASSFTSAASSFDAFCRPRCSAIGLAPDATSLRPSLTSACVSTVEVVVPSPAFWSVLEATSTRSLAPTLALRSSSSTSRAMVTPSLTTSGTPYARSSTTLRPLGPSVTLTALATASIPARRALRLASPKVTSVDMRTSVAARAPAAGRTTPPTLPT
mmetsp:Transcript_31486/g.53867  ORF Transcript_31486/g.53867 Transcript_31486/m.53867 type:complete len:220 (-) Transcript_31486:72-731(-)